MCILCVASRWSRRIVTMLPWLVIPLMILWALSQLLPPSFRFEVTSPRLACVAVLLVSLGWYELVMPKLSAWRARRRALLREKRRMEAQEVAKLRKEATRRCRNCFTAYKDQAPGSGRFMCTSCGHVSKRPVLDVPGGAPIGGGSFSLAGAASGLINGGGIFTSRSPKLWNVRGSQERFLRGWTGGRAWIDGGNWGVNCPWLGGSAIDFGPVGSGWGVGAFVGDGIFGGERCSAGESYYGIFWLVLRLVSHVLVCLGWIWWKLLRVVFPGEDGLNRGNRVCHSRGDDTGPSMETRGEKARRKAEEKRIARLEKEQLEAEERKQREEVARLVEDRRRQRDKKQEVDKESEREASVVKEKELKREKEAEKRRQKVQSKEKSRDQDFDELKKRKGRENEKKVDVAKNEGEDIKAGTYDSSKIIKRTMMDTPSKGNGMGVKVVTSNSPHSGSSKNFGSARTSFFSQSKNVAASATSFLGRSFSAGSNHASKSPKAAIPGASLVPPFSNPSTVSNGNSGKASGSAWNRIHWANVWGKAGSKIPNDIAKKLEVVESESVVKNMELTGSDSGKRLVDGDIVVPSTGGVLQQPIAPPSSVLESRDNLFSGPVGFPPVELPVDSTYQEVRQVPEGTMIHQEPYAHVSKSLLSTSFFGSSTSVTLPATQASMPCTCSDSTNIAVPSSLPSSVSSTLNMIDLAGPEIRKSLLLDSLSSGLHMSSSYNDFGTNMSALSPLHVSHLTTSPLPESPEFMSRKKNEPPQMLEPWDVPFLSRNGAKDSSTEGLWHYWTTSQPQKMNFPLPSLWDAPCQQGIDPSQLFHSTLQKQRPNQECHHRSSFFPTEYEDGSSKKAYGGEHSRPMRGSNNCIGPVAEECMLGVLEDADNDQRIPPEFVDCITHSLMQDPVIAADGHSYERFAIEAWLKSHDTSPKTGEVLPPLPGGNRKGVDKTLRPNHILRSQIMEYTERIAQGFGPQKVSVNPRWNEPPVVQSNSFWSCNSGTITGPPIRGFYPTTAVEPVWSYNTSGD